MSARFPASHTRSYAAFQHGAFLRYWLSRFLTTFATQIVSVAVGWQIYDETQNAALLGWIGLVQFLPALVLVVVTGVTADRFGRRNVMGLAVFVEMGCALAVLALALSGRFDPVWVLAALTVFGVARAFYAPASSSLAVNLVPKEDFANAVGWVTASWQLASIIGPVLGGLLYGIAAPVAYSTAVVLFLTAGLIIFTIPKPAQRNTKEPTTLSTLRPTALPAPLASRTSCCPRRQAAGSVGRRTSQWHRPVFPRFSLKPAARASSTRARCRSSMKASCG